MSTRVPPSPPAKPQRTGHYQQEYNTAHRVPSVEGNLDVMHARQSSAPIRYHQTNMLQHSASSDEFVQLRNQNSSAANIQYGNMTKHTLHALSAVPKSKLTNNWVHHRKTEQQALLPNYPGHTDSNKNNRLTESAWILNQQKRKSDPQGFNYNKHWLIQEAEQRRIEQQCGIRSTTAAKKPLPDSVIQTITQRVQSLGIGERRR
jgi:F-box protein 20